MDLGSNLFIEESRRTLYSADDQVDVAVDQTMQASFLFFMGT